MNLVGKIFTVFVFTMSVVFMALVLGLCIPHKNWRLAADNPAEPLGLVQQLESAKSENEALVRKKKTLEDDWTTERDRDAKNAHTFETENVALTKQRQADEKSLTELQSRLRDAVGAVTAMQLELKNLRDQAKQLRDDIKTAISERDASKKKVIDLTDQLHNATAERTRLEGQSQDVAQQLAKARECLRYHAHNEKSEYKAKEPPTGLQGEITDARRQDFIEVSLGSDQGLRKGHKLEVVRIGAGVQKYVGRIEVSEISPDRAVCRPVPKTQQSPIQKGDRVYANLAQAQ